MRELRVASFGTSEVSPDAGCALAGRCGSGCALVTGTCPEEEPEGSGPEGTVADAGVVTGPKTSVASAEAAFLPFGFGFGFGSYAALAALVFGTMTISGFNGL